MQVVEQTEHSSFVTVGGVRQNAFSIGNMASAFKILSNSLYSNKALAVVREVICNAVDAHIAAGKADQQISVKVSKSAFVVRDFGEGIADENMVKIYCQYFGSQKAGDETQTGGLGLGAKSPFAVSDVFYVTSHHKGKATSYTMHVGDETTEGVPSLKVMAQWDSAETGIEVTVPLADRWGAEFIRHTNCIIYSGDMRAKINDVDAPRVEYGDLEAGGYRLFSQSDFNKDKFPLSREPFYCLLNNVIYPIEIEKLSLDRDHCLHRVINKFSGVRLVCVVKAHPSTVSVTPSRESLAYDARTIESIIRLINNPANILPDFRAYHEVLKMHFQVLKVTRYDFNLAELSNAIDSMPRSNFGVQPNGCLDPRKIGLYLASLKVNRDTSTPHILKVMKMMFKDGRKPVKMDVKKQTKGWYMRQDWIKRVLRATKEFAPEFTYFQVSSDRSGSKMGPGFHGFDVKRGNVVITYSRGMARQYIHDRYMSRYFSSHDKNLVLIIRRPRPGMEDAIKAKFKKFGIEHNLWIDLNAPPEEKRAKSGCGSFPCLDGAKVSHLSTRIPEAIKPGQSTTTPEWFIEMRKLNQVTGSSIFFAPEAGPSVLKSAHTRIYQVVEYISAHYKNVAIVHNQSMLKKAQSLGAKDILANLNTKGEALAIRSKEDKIIALCVYKRNSPMDHSTGYEFLRLMKRNANIAFKVMGVNYTEKLKTIWKDWSRRNDEYNLLTGKQFSDRVNEAYTESAEKLQSERDPVINKVHVFLFQGNADGFVKKWGPVITLVREMEYATARDKFLMSKMINSFERNSKKWDAEFMEKQKEAAHKRKALRSAQVKQLRGNQTAKRTAQTELNASIVREIAPKDGVARSSVDESVAEGNGGLRSAVTEENLPAEAALLPV